MSQNITVVVVCETAVFSPSCEVSLFPCLYNYIVEEFKSVSNYLTHLALFMKNNNKKLVKNLIRDPPNSKTPSSAGDVSPD
jgi:hypothetical protein